MKPKSHWRLALLTGLIVVPALCQAQAKCSAPDLSDQQVREIVHRERSSRTDLPVALQNSKWTVIRQGCHYVYGEFGLTDAPTQRNIIKINQYGAIVDVQSGGETVDLKCPDRIFTEGELAEIVRLERGRRTDLPPPFQAYKPRVERLRCLYLYYEENLPRRPGDFHVFTIDPFGELMDFSRSQPDLTNEEVKGIIDRERASREDLPSPFPQYRWTLRREGRYYVYVEYGLPEAFHYEHLFKLNDAGVIVDVVTGADIARSMKCPEKVLSEAELAETIRRERARRDDLPPPFPSSKTRVARLRCLYQYFEYNLPEKRGDYQVFTFDPLGGLMGFSRSQPY